LRSLASVGRVEGLGILLRELGENLAARLKLAPGAGLFVVSVLPGSAAEQAGIQAGDLVTEVNRKRTRDLKSLSAVLAQSPVEEPVVLKVRRGETSRTLTLSPP
jgi:serine protease Do